MRPTAPDGAGSPLPGVLARILEGDRLDAEDAGGLLEALASDDVPPALAGALLAALRMRRETGAELRGFAAALRRLARRPDLPPGLAALDIVGTGGDGSGSLNLSTGAALLAAAAGVPVVKHGNRSVSSRCGSADVLEELGLPLPLDEQAAGRCLEACGFTFLDARHYHPAVGALGPVRRALGVATTLNLVGPLANPAAPAFAVIGACTAAAAAAMAEALSGLPIERAFVVHGAFGWDEPTPAGPFLQFEVRPGKVERRERDPAGDGFRRCHPSDLLGGDAADNARRLRAALEGEPGPHRDALVLGAALGLEVAGRAASLGDGRALAEAAIAGGAARRLLDRLAAFGREEKARG
ncbi:MAG TPA: anthranilate phosphoribosyltransferase [Candidatus Cryosericum sp.]|nr:anthranilate phosphoribosyltransferase [Candidatus Cryosericum sp.]